jgi:hypothetical protein
MNRKNTKKQILNINHIRLELLKMKFSKCKKRNFISSKYKTKKKKIAQLLTKC